MDEQKFWGLKFAEGGANVLSNIKLIVPEALLNEINSPTRKNISAWPNRYVLDSQSWKELIERYLQSKNISFTNNFVAGFSIEYNEYEFKKNQFKQTDHKTFEYYKQYFALSNLQLLSNNKNTKVYLAYRVQLEENEIPKSTSDTEPLEIIENYGDCLFTFEDNDKKIKVPSFYGTYLFKELELFSNKEITIEHNRKKVMTNKIDSKGRKPRIIISSSKLDYLQSVFKKSKLNFEKLIEDADLFNLSQKMIDQYNKLKLDPGWRDR